MSVTKMSLTRNKNIQALFVLYLLSNTLLLLNINGIYWDDWVIYNQPFSEIKSMYNQTTGNAHLFEYLFLALSRIGNGIASFRLTTFIVYFLSGLFLYFILLDIKSISRNTAFYIALLFLILPVNSARIVLCVVHYGVFLCVFFLAFWLLTRYINKQGGILFRILILALFYLSFFVNSLLVFYAIVLLYILYKHHEPGQSIIHCIKTLFLHYSDFIGLPVLFFYIKTHYFVPYGLYENYNAVSWDYFKHHIGVNLLLSFKTAFYKPLSQAFIVFFRFWYLSLMIVVFLFWYLAGDRQQIKPEPAVKLLILGVLFFILAIFPYAAIGKVPSLLYFDSRHMLLVPLGSAFCLYSSLLFIGRKNQALAHVLLITLLASCMLKNMHDQAQYLKDWFYQVALAEHYKENKTIQNNTTFLFRTNIGFANQRTLKFYEHNGLLRKTFGDDTRFMGDNRGALNTYAAYKQYPRYNFSSWAMSTPVIITAKKNVNHDMTIKPFLRLLAYMLTDEVAFRQEAKTLITMDLG